VDIDPISLPRLALSFAPVAAVLLLMWRWRFGIGQPLYAIARMLLQLALIGFVLVYVFRSESALLVSAVLTLMVVSASWIALNTIDAPRGSLFPASLVAVLLGGAVYLLPIYAEDILMVGATGFGWLRSAPALGAFCMALLLIYLPPMKRAGWMLLLNIAGFGVATIIFGLTQSFWVAFVMLFLTGAFDNVSMVIRHTLQQLLTPDRMRGRVSAVTSVFVGASNELGGLESGLVAHWFGPVISVVSGGIGTLIVVVTAGLLSPDLRSLGGLHDTEPVDETTTDAGHTQPADTDVASQQATAADD